MNILISFFLAGAVGASAQIPAASLIRIGAAAAVKGRVNAMAPGATVGRVVESGKPLYLNDHVTTNAAGHLQVLLLDQTVFTMGPSSDMVLDEFVYDPASDNGKVTARITKGVFRFVTGKVARRNPASMKVTLPVGTIGIRGTIAAGQVSGQSATVILLGPGSQNNANENAGAISVYNAQGRVELTQPGFGTTITGGQGPTTPANMSLQLQHILGVLAVPPKGLRSASTGGPSATQASGQGTAAGGALANTSEEILNLSNLANTAQTVAAQTGSTIADGIAAWQQVLSIQTGIATVSGTGSYTCSGGSDCSVGGSGQYGYSVSVNFASRQFGGAGSFLSINSGTLPSTSANMNPVSYASFSGVAPYTLQAADLSGGPGSFAGTMISFQNHGGVVAKDLNVNLNYQSTLGGIATGSATQPIPGR
jgi:hypothetical protein